MSDETAEEKKEPVKDVKPEAPVETPEKPTEAPDCCKASKPLLYTIVAVLLICFGIELGLYHHAFDKVFEKSEVVEARMPKGELSILHKDWKDYLAMPEDVRRLCMRDQSYRNTLCAKGWKSPNPDNQFIGKEYAAWVTEDIPPRVLNVPGIVNVRDFGGWKTKDGKRIKQGLIIRSGELNAKSHYHLPGRTFVNMENQKILVKDLGIKTDIDLRWNNEVEGMTQSPISPEVTWKHYPWSLYQWVGDPRERETFFKIFRDLCNTNNLPAIVHCVYGKDRTGTLCYILQGILGVSDDDKLKDWEASAFWYGDGNFTHQRGIDGLIYFLKSSYRGDTLNDNCVAYALSCGLNDEDIRIFRRLMLEDDQ